MATAAARRFAQSLVACNVYVSAGGKPSHAALLLNLLERAQQWSSCKDEVSSDTSLSTSKTPSDSSVNHKNIVSIVHAYADPVYNRSSIHLAGTAPDVARVASQLATQAVTDLRNENEASSQQAEDARHPFVGFVDHVAVMPLHNGAVECLIEDDDAATDTTTDVFIPTTASGWAARQVGHALGDLSTTVYYYGSAHPEQTPLATVRRERTNFFTSGSLSADQNAKQPQVATVGAPLGFVENYNVRLNHSSTKSQAQSLTRHVRERDGGLPGVEALTLPYSKGRWEVACNLLRPDLASATDVQLLVDMWQDDQSTPGLVERGYRVGTTVEQCQKVLKLLSSSEEERWEHDCRVRHRLKFYLENPQ